MKIVIFLFIFFLFEEESFSSDQLRDDCLNNPMFATIYFQESEDTQNYSEDRVLLNLVSVASENLSSVLKLKKIDERKREELSDFVQKECLGFIPLKKQSLVYIDDEEKKELENCRQEFYDQNLSDLKCGIFNVSRKAPFTSKEMSERLMKVLASYEDKTKKSVFIGDIHKWDEENKSELRREFPVASRFSKVLTSLAMGVGPRFMKTNKDAELRAWLESQELTSVEIEDLFYKSLELQDGDLYRALLSISNILSEFWKEKDRNHLLQTSKLKSITNHCPGILPEDVFGSWYHMFGMMLYGCVSGHVSADLVARIESAGGRVLDSKSVKRQGENVLLHLLIGSDPQEEKINRISGHVGAKLCQSVKKANP